MGTTPTPLDQTQAPEGSVPNTPTPVDQNPGGQTWTAAAEGNKTPVATTPSTSEATVDKEAMPAQPETPPLVITPVKRPGILGVMDTVADALAGKTTPEIATDNQGNKYVKETTLSRGQQWARVAGSGILGAAAGATQHGVDSAGRAVEAGVEASQKQQAQQKADEANMSAEARQQNLDNANNQMLQMKKAEMAFQAKQLQVKADRDTVDWVNKDIDQLTKPVDQGGGGGQNLGTMAGPNELRNILKVQPDVMQRMVQDGTIQIRNNYGEDGSVHGIHVIMMPKAYTDQIAPAGSTLQTYDPVTDKLVPQQISDPMPKRQLDNLNSVAVNSQTDKAIKKATLDKTNAETASANATASEAPSKIQENKANAAKATAEAKTLNNASSQDEIQGNAKQLVEGTMDPANLSKRSKSYDATLTAANAYSMATTGKPFDVAKAAGDYKYATNPQTYNTLNFLNSLTGRDNASGNLGTVVAMSDKLGQGQYPALNDAAQWAKLAAGNPDIPAYHAALVETSDQIAKILQGGGSGSGTSDAKLKQAGELLDKGFNPAQMKSTAETLRTLLGNRKQEMIGDNRYLMRWQGAPQQAAAPQQQQAPAAQPSNSPPQGMANPVQFKASDGSYHWIPQANLDGAKKIDPKLQVLP